MSGIGRQELAENKASVRANDLSVTVDDVRQVEQNAANAWPATEITQNQGWQIRLSPGVSNRRANSVLPMGPAPNGSVLDHINAVETFYQSHGLPSRFMISPAAQPENLDEKLENLGYHTDAPTLVQWGNINTIIEACGSNGAVELSIEPDAGWMGVYMEGIDDAQEIALKTNLLRRINAPCALAQINHINGPTAVGLSVVDRDWAGVFCMHTLQSHRRQGLARQVLGGLMEWAQKQGAKKAYLQVECDNPSAQEFYQTAGFSTEYGYHYRTKETVSVSQ